MNSLALGHAVSTAKLRGSLGASCMWSLVLKIPTCPVTGVGFFKDPDPMTRVRSFMRLINRLKLICYGEKQ